MTQSLQSFQGDGDVRARLRGHDWGSSPLGAPATWPPALATAVDMALCSTFPMFVAWGPQLGLLYNDAYARILGDKHPAALGAPFQRIRAEIWTDIAPIVQRALDGTSSYCEDLPLTVQRKGYSEPSWFTFSYSPLHDADGSVGGMYCTVIETTDRVLAERRAARVQAELTAADQRKDEFLAMLAHELRNPLAPISAAAELLRIGKLDETRVRQASGIIGRQVKHMTTLVDDLLDVSRVTRGLVELDKAPVDARAIVEEAVEQVRPKMQARQQQLSLQLPGEPVTVLGDKARLVQVMVNLLDNASKYSPERRAIEVRAALANDELVLEVIDEGIGIEPELTGRVFALFAQAQRPSDRSQGGLGLGLALVRHLVELHGGAVRCFSAGLGMGSRFEVRLPVQRAASDAQVPAGDAVQCESGQLSLMVVDDNIDAATTLAMLLRASGHEVRVEHASMSALEAARAAPPDACLLDIGLPEIDGNELARRLHGDPRTAGIVLIAVTGYGQEHDRDTAAAAGFRHHLVKPVDIDKLAATLASVRLSAFSASG